MTMKSSLKTLLSGCGAVALAVFCSGTAMAQYYNDGYDRRYDRRYERPSYDRGYDRGRRDGSYRRDGDGYGRDDRRYGRDGGGYRRGPDPSNPLAGMSIEDQKRAIKNQRDAQKKAIKRGYLLQ
jgi:hypothetical protein